MTVQNLRISGAPVWSHCAANPIMESRLPPRPDSDAAREGTCAAWLADQVMKGVLPDAAAGVGLSEPERGWMVTDDMADIVQRYVDWLGPGWVSERAVVYNPLIRGTTDAVSLVTVEGVLKVVDLKYGYGIIEPTSEQLTLYGAGLITPAVKSVELTIYQPRAFHPDGHKRTRTVSRDQLLQEASDIASRGTLCTMPDPTATPGPHCAKCDATHTCGAAAAALYRITETMAASRQRDMTPAELAQELDFLEAAASILKGRARSIEAEATARIGRGEVVPGWGLDRKRGNRSWTVGAEAVHALTGIDPVDRKKMVTPAALERAAGDRKKEVKAIVASITRTPEGEPTLTRRKADHFTKQFGGR